MENSVVHLYYLCIESDQNVTLESIQVIGCPRRTSVLLVNSTTCSICNQANYMLSIILEMDDWPL